jgi:hypothetical protein
MFPPAESTAANALAMNTLRRMRRLRDTRLCPKIISFRCTDYQLESEGIVWLSKNSTRYSNSCTLHSFRFNLAGREERRVRQSAGIGSRAR